MSMLYLGIPEANIVEKHLECLQRYCGSNAKANSLASQYVHKLGMIIKRSTHELDLDDRASISMWVERNKKSIFIHQDTSEDNSFILGIQTEWQLQQMIRFGHRSLIAADSTFGIRRLKVIGLALEFTKTYAYQSLLILSKNCRCFIFLTCAVSPVYTSRV